MSDHGRLTPLSLTTLSVLQVNKQQQVGSQILRLLSVTDGECRLTCANGVTIHLLGSLVVVLQNISSYKITFISSDAKLRQLDFFIDTSTEGLYPVTDFFKAYPALMQLSYGLESCLVLEDAYGIVPVTLNTLAITQDAFTQPMAELALAGMLACLSQGIQQPSSANIHLATALSYIHQNYMNYIGAGDIAAYAGIHVNYLHRLFVQKTGKRLLAYITEYRLKKAQMMLITTNWSVAQIAQASGFSSRSYFTKVFHKNMGIPPHSFRKTYDITSDYTARAKDHMPHSLKGGRKL